ncbi:hypothetical protein C8Q70DRAFT_389618 [Cubamyces menziesii]|nr:hypothetical protein C8Q70DRAFT_389618 [Cubamyces menziesii]
MTGDRLRGRPTGQPPELLSADGVHSVTFDDRHPTLVGVYPEHSGSITQRDQLLDMVRQREEERGCMHFLTSSYRAPISRLPAELLAEVFLYVKGNNAHWSGWHRILSVCRHWFVVGATMPRLWNHICVRRSVDHLRVSLARSKTIPVEIDLKPTGMSRTGNLALAEVISIIMPHVHRLRALRLGTISAADVPNALAFLRSRSFPVLRALTAYPESQSHILELEPHRFPGLRELCFERLNVFSSIAVMSQLTTLRFNAFNGLDDAFTMDSLLTAISSMANLEDLVLSHVYFRNTVTYPSAHSKVGFSRLRSVEMTMDAAVTRRLLSYMIIPPSSRVYLALSLVHATSPQTFQDILPSDKSSLPILSELTAIRISATWAMVAFRGSILPDDLNASPTLAYRFQVVVDVPDYEFEEADPELDDALEVLEYTPEVHALYIQTSVSMSTGAAWLHALSGLPKLQRLTVVLTFDAYQRTEGTTVNTILSTLSSPPVETLAHDGVICPNLKRLRLVGSWKWTVYMTERVVEYLEARRQLLGRQIALQELSIALHGRLPNADFEGLRKGFEEAASPFVGRVVFESKASPLEE